METSGRTAVMGAVSCRALSPQLIPVGQTLRKEALNEKPSLVLKFFLNKINKKTPRILQRKK